MAALSPAKRALFHSSTACDGLESLSTLSRDSVSQATVGGEGWWYLAIQSISFFLEPHHCWKAVSAQHHIQVPLPDLSKAVPPTSRSASLEKTQPKQNKPTTTGRVRGQRLGVPGLWRLSDWWKRAARGGRKKAAFQSEISS